MKPVPALSGVKQKLAERVARRIEDDIVRRGWPVGEGLGSEAELVVRYGVSRAILREALGILTYKQVVAMRRGRSGGLVVHAPAAAVVAGSVATYLHLIGVSVDELYDARITLEVLAARLAARRIVEDDIERLRTVAATDPIGMPPSLVIAEVSRNPMLAILVPTLTRVTGALAGGPRPDFRLGPSAKSARGHALRAIAESVVSGDEATAARRMRRHLEGERTWLKRATASSEVPAAAPASGATSAERIALTVAGAIRREGHAPGHVVGNEAALRDRLQVGRAMFREAVRILEHNGVAQMRQGPGGGLVVARPDPVRVVQALALYLEWLAVTPADLLEVRAAVELRVVELAAARFPGADPEPLLASLTAAPDGGRAEAGVLVTLAGLAGNRLLALFTAAFGRLSSFRTAEPAHDALARIVDAVVVGDSSLARNRTARYLQVLAGSTTPGTAVRG
ncbi:DNA-binding FadR family transcriptional regulator [Pseudonocardia kunmingensis]|uniref:DNA-binding FadR family transcriptional regulator n=2 Tax=Pseudonocardia kunmingensis TaxID=630975 RepID=A0A543DPT9_9PSEU|nr:DNA-binding FadR family transcriptional regulator [Pseudonocardia kunmingensis]